MQKKKKKIINNAANSVEMLWEHIVPSYNWRISRLFMLFHGLNSLKLQTKILCDNEFQNGEQKIQII